jgi:membrane protease YdiL (CAAX protease family)
LWPVLVAYIAAFAAVFVLSGLAAAMLASLYPDVPPAVLLKGLPGLLAGGMASSAALVLTLALVVRSPAPRQLRLLPGRESGRHLLAMIVGVLALGQALDSLTTLAGLGRHGPMQDIRRALAGAAGEDLFLAVLVIGVLAGSTEELFFRAFIQTRLRARWSPVPAIGITSLGFAVMHLDPLHGSLAFALGLYLGFITELAGSALPAVASHVINNTLFTLLTALVGTVDAFWPNVVLLAGSTLVLVISGTWLWRTLRPADGGRPA